MMVMSHAYGNIFMEVPITTCMCTCDYWYIMGGTRGTCMRSHASTRIPTQGWYYAWVELGT